MRWPPCATYASAGTSSPSGPLYWRYSTMRRRRWTGDLPTPVKYYNPDIRGAYGAVEKAAEQTLLSLLPSDLQDSYSPLLGGGQRIGRRAAQAGQGGGQALGTHQMLGGAAHGEYRFPQGGGKPLESGAWPASAGGRLFPLDEFLPAYSLTLDETQPGQLHAKGPFPDKPGTGGEGRG